VKQVGTLQWAETYYDFLEFVEKNFGDKPLIGEPRTYPAIMHFIIEKYAIVVVSANVMQIHGAIQEYYNDQDTENTGSSSGGDSTLDRNQPEAPQDTHM